MHYSNSNTLVKTLCLFSKTLHSNHYYQTSNLVLINQVKSFNVFLFLQFSANTIYIRIVQIDILV